MIIKVERLRFDKKIQNLCKKPYPGHKYGCPNYGKRDTCPPKCRLIDDYMDVNDELYLIFVEFDLEAHRERMRKIHPNWSIRQLSCVLYWQNGVRKKLRGEIERFLNEYGRNFIISPVPEACGVNMTVMMKDAGYRLSWKYPLDRIYKVALAGKVNEGCDDDG